MKLLSLTMLAAMSAFPHTITYDKTVPHLGQMINLQLNGKIVDVSAGQIGVRFDDTLPALLYCADPLTWLEVGPTAVSPILETAFVNGARLAWLYNTYNPTLTEDWEAAALQLAFWEVILDNNSDDLSSGRAQKTVDTDSRVATLTDAMLSASVGKTSSGVTFWVPGSGPSASQTLFAAAIPNFATAEPFTGILFGAGLLMIGALRLRAN